MIRSQRSSYATGSSPSTATLTTPASCGGERCATSSMRLAHEVTVKKSATPSKDKTAAIHLERLEAMAEEATVDAYNESEQICGWACTLEAHVALPFETIVLGDAVTVDAIEQRGATRIVAICKRGRSRQAIDILEL